MFYVLVRFVLADLLNFNICVYILCVVFFFFLTGKQQVSEIISGLCDDTYEYVSKIHFWNTTTIINFEPDMNDIQYHIKNRPHFSPAYPTHPS